MGICMPGKYVSTGGTFCNYLCNCKPHFLGWDWKLRQNLQFKWQQLLKNISHKVWHCSIQLFNIRTHNAWGTPVLVCKQAHLHWHWYPVYCTYAPDTSNERLLYLINVLYSNERKDSSLLYTPTHMHTTHTPHTHHTHHTHTQHAH